MTRARALDVLRSPEEYLVAEVAPLPAAERVAAVRLESYRARMTALADEAFQLAHAASAGPGFVQARSQAAELAQKLDRLLAEVAATEGLAQAVQHVHQSAVGCAAALIIREIVKWWKCQTITQGVAFGLLMH